MNWNTKYLFRVAAVMLLLFVGWGLSVPARTPSNSQLFAGIGLAEEVGIAMSGESGIDGLAKRGWFSKVRIKRVIANEVYNCKMNRYFTSYTIETELIGVFGIVLDSDVHRPPYPAEC